MMVEKSKSEKTALYPKENYIPILLSFIAAFVDVICYLALFRTFTAFITGTLIILASEVIHPDGVWMMKALVVLTFIMGLFLWLILLQKLKDWKYVRAAVLAVEAGLLGAFMISGMYFSPLLGADTPETILVALIAVFAMTLQNAVMAKIFHQHVPTTVMTGNFARFAISVIDIFGPERASVDRDKDAAYKTRRQLRHYCYVLTAFSAGALAGAVSYNVGGFLALACPIIILIALAIHQWRIRHDSNL